MDANGNAYGGFMHTAGQNGLNTLLDVVNHYDSIPQDNPNLDQRLRPGGNLQRLRLTAQEKANIVAFIRTLTGSDVYTNAKWSNPFTNDSLTLIPLGIGAVSNENNITVYPTVASRYINIKYPSAMQNSKMMFTDMNGRVLYSGSITTKLDISAYAAGMYLVKFENGKAVRVIKQ